MIKPDSSAFPEAGAFRARLASGELSDAFAQSYGLLAAHGRNVRRAYRLEPDGRVSDMSWRTLCVLAVAEERADLAERKAADLARFVGRATDIAEGPNGAGLRSADMRSARETGESLRGLARCLASGDAAGAISALAGVAHGAWRMNGDADASKRGHAACAASLARAEGDKAALMAETALSLADRKQLAGSPFSAARCAARLLETWHANKSPATLGAAIGAAVELERQACASAAEARDATAALHSLQAVNAANAEARAKAERESAAYREQRDAEGARAVAAERQLAEYRTLMAALPLGMARAYPAAFPLLRAYLADLESAK